MNVRQREAGRSLPAPTSCRSWSRSSVVKVYGGGLPAASVGTGNRHSRDWSRWPRPGGGRAHAARRRDHRTTNGGCGSGRGTTSCACAAGARSSRDPRWSTRRRRAPSSASAPRSPVLRGRRRCCHPVARRRAGAPRSTSRRSRTRWAFHAGRRFAATFDVPRSFRRQLRCSTTYRESSSAALARALRRGRARPVAHRPDRGELRQRRRARCGSSTGRTRQ